ncbi:hypothetical protein [Kolteria novifilia]
MNPLALLLIIMANAGLAAMVGLASRRKRELPAWRQRLPLP